MKRMFFTFVVLLASAICFSQENPVFNIEDKTINIVKEYGANISATVTRSVYGKVRIVDASKECPDIRVWFVEAGQIHDFGVSVVDHSPKDGEWQFVSRKGDEDFTIGLSDPFQADVFVLVTGGYNPQTKKHVKKR